MATLKYNTLKTKNNMLTFFNNLKNIAFVLLLLWGVYFYAAFQHEKTEAQRQEANNRQLRLRDSLALISQTFTLSELKDYLASDNKDLKNKLEKDKISSKRIVQIDNYKHSYIDTLDFKNDLSDIKKALLDKKNTKKVFNDTTGCIKVKGFVEVFNDSISFRITEKNYKTVSNGVVYWERKPWKFLFIKSRILGKKQFTSKVYDSCGTTTIFKIEKKK
jgi:hypothetical protein